MAQRAECEPASESRGYYHLTPRGWFRVDEWPFPPDRVETWLVESELPAEDAKERDSLTRVWVTPDVAECRLAEIRTKFGDAIPPSKDRALTIQCDV